MQSRESTRGTTTFNIWSSEFSKYAFGESLYWIKFGNVLSLLYNLLHQGLLTIFTKLLLQSVLWKRRTILSYENATSMSVSSTESKFLCYDVAETSDFVIFTALIFSNSIFSLLKRVTDGSFLFYGKRSFFFPYLSGISAKIRCPQNQYISHYY